MISGRKLLIADDSATIQKVVDLTFSDEGMQVTSVGDGDEAVARLEELAPDVVLADIFMPGLSGYEVCEAIKHSERFRHIPVMLLVGSFEPFDVAEARRVGADDVVTKPFQSIRELVNRVGTLLGGKPAERDETSVAEAPTGELSALGHEGQPAEDGPEASVAEVNGELSAKSARELSEEQSPDELMSTAEIELTTADTLPLAELESGQGHDHDAIGPGAAGGSAPDVAKPPGSGNAASDQERAYWAARLANESEPASQNQESKQQLRVEPMEKSSEQRWATTRVDEFDDLLLDLGDLDSAPVPVALEDSVLELEDEALEPVPAPAVYEAESFGSAVMAQGASLHDIPYATEVQPEWAPAAPSQSTRESAGDEQDLGAAWAIVPPAGPFERVTDDDSYKQQASHEGSASLASDRSWTEAAGALSGAPVARSESASRSSGNRLAPEDIDAIARRVVEQLSEKAVREIAWEVVPELAELMIKRRLEEEN